MPSTAHGACLGGQWFDVTMPDFCADMATSWSSFSDVKHPSGRSHPWPAARWLGPACLYKTRKFGVMGASTVVVALAGVGSFLAAVVVGVFIVVGGRGNESRVSQRARRFLTWLRDEFKPRVVIDQNTTSVLWRVATCHRRPRRLVVRVIDALDLAPRRTVRPADPYPYRADMGSRSPFRSRRLGRTSRSGRGTATQWPP